MQKLKVKEKIRLSSLDSEKDVYHISLLNDGVHYETGDVLKIYPQNSLRLAKSMSSFYDFDFQSFDLRIGDRKLLEVLSKRDSKLKELLNPVNFIAFKRFIMSNTVPEILEKHGIVELDELIGCLRPMRPRSYSIASSMRAFPNEIHLTVSLEKFASSKGLEVGTASGFIINDLSVGDAVKAEHTRKPDFKLPNEDKDIIMIGAGTGIAPYVGFLQERSGMGKNWLFFGEGSAEKEFYYRDFLLLNEKRGLILDTAFSRDQEEKIYVQHKLWEKKEQFMNWLDSGAYVYICGDAKKMAKDVEQTILRILAERTERPEEELLALKEEGRYLLDVY